ncbi:glutathione S-transferase N-terminal domain-containing protein [Halomonas sp. TRM85114]|uniref:glutaredoxin family protein n=1 Tax=Halomonas jincaotanensis TaxID=2810616 RepID=UPI001BD4DCAB|nr:glutathione S-transferase N-terminal domain-containing protein [Halomonas jincaotanensis]MBS9404563.1 glutathione S-transferase N-terminal domain-containing protein [Halomonas jincaotanensis]
MPSLLKKMLAPLEWVADKLGTSAEVERSPEEQARVDQACQHLALYQFRSCPFSIKVRREITRLNLKIEVRDAQLDPEHRRELKEGGGKVQVPCLRIANPDGPAQWMYESRDIIAWLRQRFGAETVA